MRRRSVVVFLGGALTAAFAACSFPEIDFTVTDSGTTPDGMVVSDATPIADGPLADTSAPPQHDVDPEGGAADAQTRDANTVIDHDAGADGGCGMLPGTPCDCDEDTAPKEGGACVSPINTAPDCDDFDPFIHPGVGFVAVPWDTASPHLPAGDWDCDGVVTKQYNYNIGCSLFDCTEGFPTDVPCGIASNYNYCKGLTLLGVSVCQVDHTETKTQGCH